MANTVHVNVSGTWKQASAYYVNVNGTWKTGSEFQANVSGTWKGGSSGPVGLPSAASILALDFIDFSLPVFVIDAKASINSKTLDFIDFSLPTVGKDI